MTQTQIEAKIDLKEKINLDDTIYCVIRHVSKSGMTRHISFHYIKWNELYSINNIISDLLGYKMNKYHDAIVVGGCGMDMAFSVVNNLQAELNNNKYLNPDLTYNLKHRII